MDFVATEYDWLIIVSKENGNGSGNGQAAQVEDVDIAAPIDSRSLDYPLYYSHCTLPSQRYGYDDVSCPRRYRCDRLL